VEPGVVDRLCNDGEIEFPIEDRLGEMDFKIFPDIDLQIWMPPPAPGYQGRQKVGSQGGDRPDRDSTAKGRAISQFLGRIFNLKEDPFGSFQEDNSRLGWDGLVAKSVEQLVAKLLFKFYNLLA
jgi:hypothetical protein